MEEEKKINRINLTFDAEIDSFQPGDNTISLTGVIIRLDPPLRRRSRYETENDNTPFRCIFSNLSGRLIRILFWAPRKQEYEGAVLKQIVRISRPQVLLSNPQYVSRNNNNLMNIEISVQKHTTIELLGSVVIEDEELVYDGITFVDIPNSLGKLVAIEGYVRTPIEKIVSNNSTYGNGAITDSYFRLPIHVTTFDTDEPIPAGAAVKVQGRLSSNDFNPITLQVQNRENIKIINLKGLSLDAIRLGYHKILPKDNTENKKCESDPSTNDNTPSKSINNNSPAKTTERKSSSLEKPSINANRRKYSDVVKNTIISKVSRMDESVKPQSQQKKPSDGNDESNINFDLFL